MDTTRQAGTKTIGLAFLLGFPFFKNIKFSDNNEGYRLSFLLESAYSKMSKFQTTTKAIG